MAVDRLLAEWTAYALVLPVFAWVTWDAAQALWRQRQKRTPPSLLVLCGAQFALTYAFVIFSTAAFLRWRDGGMLHVDIAQFMRTSGVAAIVVVEIGFLHLIRGGRK